MRYGLFAAIRRASLVLNLLVALSIPVVWNSPAKAGTTVIQPAPGVCAPAGITITQPGEYDLGGDVTCTAVAGGDGIDIETSGVTLHLNGHTISSTCPALLNPPSIGIHVFNPTVLPTLTLVHILGDGTIRGFDIGVEAANSAGSYAKSVTITDVCTDGIVINPPSGSSTSQWKLHKNAVTNAPTGILLLGDDNDLVLNTITGGANSNGGIVALSNNNTIVNNTASRNTAVGSRGISVQGANNDLQANTTDGNAFGIFVENGAINNNITGNESSGNTTFDMDDENKPPFSATPCDNNKWTGNHFMTANQSCIN